MARSPSDDRGYLDVPYVRQFSPELSPGLLRAVAALAGSSPPPADDFDYCELGSGLGDTLVTLAAAYPRARFVGIDLKADHVEAARSLASRGALDNVHFLERDLEDVREGELPSLDYVGAHGLLTWIAPAKRRALFAFAAARLKPGGLLYLGYSALPGWAAVEPLRRLLLDSAASVEGSGAERIAHALSTARKLSDANAEYFVANPSAREVLGVALNRGVSYAAHEFFVPHWQPMYFADVVEEAAAHGLGFAGQIPLHLNFADVTIAPALHEAFRSVGDRRAWERLRAFASNELFRRDVFVRGPAPSVEGGALAYLEDTPFGTMVSADQVTRELQLPGQGLRFAGPLFDALIASLAGRASTVRRLASDPALASFGLDAIRQAVLHLAMGPDVMPMARSAGSAGAGALHRVPSAFNRAVLGQAPSPGHAITLASPVAGTGVGLSTLHAVALRALTEAPPEGRAAWIRAFVGSNSLLLWDHGRRLDDKDELARALGAQVEGFRAARLPKLIELGVVESGPSRGR